MRSLALLRTLTVLLLALAPLAHGDPEPDRKPDAAPAAAPTAPNPTEWKRFQVGGYLIGQGTSKFSPGFPDVDRYAPGIGIGFLAGFRPHPFVTFGVFIEATLQTIQKPSNTSGERAINGGLGPWIKIYPLQDSPYRFYASAGLALATYRADSDSDSIFQSEGPSYLGYRGTLGIGYEHTFLPNLALFGELNMMRTTLTKRTVGNDPATDVTQPMSRWIPCLLVGMLAQF